MEQTPLNTDNFFEVFKYHRDHYSWDKHVEFANRYENINEQLRKSCIDSLYFLKEELGSGFLKTGGKNHALYQMIIEKSEWRISSLIEFTEVLKALKGSNSNYQKLLKKLGSQDRFRREGLPFTQIAQMYLTKGFSIYFPDEIEGQKNPDIKIYLPHNNDRFIIEVTMVEESHERQLFDNNYKTLWNTLEFENCLPFSCNQLKYIEPNEMSLLIAEIQNVKRQAIADCEIIHYQNDKIRLAVSHPDKYNELQSWVIANDFRMGLLGAPLNFDDTSRICNYKIGQKTKQIPPGETGMLYLAVNPLYFWQFNFEDTIDKFQRQMEFLPNVFGVVGFAYLIAETESESLSKGKHHLGIKRMNETVTRYLFFVHNAAYKGSLKEETIKNIYSTFE